MSSWTLEKFLRPLFSEFWFPQPSVFFIPLTDYVGIEIFGKSFEFFFAKFLEHSFNNILGNSCKFLRNFLSDWQLFWNFTWQNSLRIIFEKLFHKFLRKWKNSYRNYFGIYFENTLGINLCTFAVMFSLGYRFSKETNVNLDFFS